MKLKKIVISWVFFLILFSSINLSTIANNIDKNNLSNGLIEERNGIKILFIEGSNYEMGYQHGSSLKYECLENIRAVLSISEKHGYSYGDLLENWNKSKDYIPQNYIDEMQGLADGIGVPFEKIAAIYIAFDCLAFFNCFGIVAWGDATDSKKLIHIRSSDLPFDFKDPVTGKFVHENNFLVVRKPENGYASIAPSIAGLPNLVGGFNEKQIGISTHLSQSRDQNFYGPPLRVKAQMIQDTASNAQQAIDILTSNKTLGYTFVVSDGKIPIGYAVEVSGNYSYNGTWDNPVESEFPFWLIKNVVRRTNFFIDPVLVKTQRNRFNPGGIIGFLRAIIASVKETLNPELKNKYSPDLIYPIWRNYKIISREIEKKWGKLDIDNSLSIIRDTYNGKTDFLLKIMGRLGKDHGFLVTWNQWAACPETGDIFVSFASHDKYASQNPIHHFNLYELINT